MASRAQLAPSEPALRDGAAARACASHVHAVDWRSMDTPEARIAWDALAQCAVEPNPFYESWYLLPSLRALDPQNRVSLLRFDLAGQCAGILPVTRERHYYSWPIPQMRNWVHTNCFLGAPLVVRGAEREFWGAVLNWADASAGLSLFLHLTDLPLGGPLYAALRDVAAEQGRTAALVHREERAMLASSLSPGAYLEGAISHKKRKELRRQYNRLSEQGALTIERRDDAGDLDFWTTRFLDLEAAGWKGAAGSALASDPANADIFRTALEGAAQRGRLERLSMSIDGDPIAMLVSFLTAPGAFSYKTAFDERYSRFSPGVLLQRENLAMLDRPDIRWTDSCASVDHPMIDHVWRERRTIGSVSIAIGGHLRRAAFNRLVRAELGRNPVEQEL